MLVSLSIIAASVAYLAAAPHSARFVRGSVVIAAIATVLGG